MRTKLNNDEAKDEEITGLIDLVCDNCATVLLECILVQIPELRNAKVSS